MIFLSPKWEYNEEMAFHKIEHRTSPDIESASALTLDFSVLGLWEINFCGLSHPNCGNLLKQPELRYLFILIFFISPH